MVSELAEDVMFTSSASIPTILRPAANGPPVSINLFVSPGASAQNSMRSINEKVAGMTFGHAELDRLQVDRIELMTLDALIGHGLVFCDV